MPKLANLNQRISSIIFVLINIKTQILRDD